MRCLTINIQIEKDSFLCEIGIKISLELLIGEEFKNN